MKKTAFEKAGSSRDEMMTFFAVMIKQRGAETGHCVHCVIAGDVTLSGASMTYPHLRAAPFRQDHMQRLLLARGHARGIPAGSQHAHLLLLLLPLLSIGRSGGGGSSLPKANSDSVMELSAMLCEALRIST